MGRNYKIVEAVKTAVLALLSVSLVLLVIIYIGGTHIYQSMISEQGKQPFDKLWSVQSDVDTDGIDSSRLIPELVGYKLAGSEPVGCISDGLAAAELYELVSPCLVELFGSGSKCAALDASEGAMKMSQAAGSSEFVYLRYHEPVMYQMIYSYAAGKLIVADGNTAVMGEGVESVYVSEIIIVPDMEAQGHRFIALANDGAGGYFEFTRGDGVVDSVFFMSKLAAGAGSESSIATIGFGFAEDAQLSPTQPIFGAELETEQISSEPISLIDSELDTALLRLFDYNPDKLDSYRDDSGVTYVNSRGRLRMSSGELIYQAGDPSTGIRLEGLLGYSVDKALSLYDKLTAVDNIISRLDDISHELIGGEASLCLGEVYTEGGLLVFEYFYTYNNIRIMDAPAIRAVLSQDTLYSFELSAQSYKGSDKYELCPRQSYVLRKLRESGELTDEDTDGRMRLVYRGGAAAWSVFFEGHE